MHTSRYLLLSLLYGLANYAAIISRMDSEIAPNAAAGNGLLLCAITTLTSARAAWILRRFIRARPGAWILVGVMLPVVSAWLCGVGLAFTELAVQGPRALVNLPWLVVMSVFWLMLIGPAVVTIVAPLSMPLGLLFAHLLLTWATDGAKPRPRDHAERYRSRCEPFWTTDDAAGLV